MNIEPLATSAQKGDPPSYVERQLGETEVSYFLPSREDGVNDMYLHLGFEAPKSIMEHPRISAVWAMMRIRHPLLASSVVLNTYEDVRFKYAKPDSPEDAIKDAVNNLEYRVQSKDDLIDAYLNGPRTLSNEQLSYLVVAQQHELEGSQQQAIDDVSNYDLLICATHFLGDGMALHQFANDFFKLLAGPLDQTQLLDQLHQEWSERCNDTSKDLSLPPAVEDRLPNAFPNRWSRAAARIDFKQSQHKLVGGHSFPRQSGKPRKTIVPTIALDRDKTKIILKNCKSHGVSISSALFAICNVAWSRTRSEGWELPMMMYSALNIRPNLTQVPHDSYWFIAIGYFNVVLPTFLPLSGKLESTFWHRALSAKVQSTKAAKSRFLISRCQEMARERGARARVWAKEDDDRLAGIPSQKPTTTPSKPKVPSHALMGLSLLGNLDGMYKHALYPRIRLHTLTTGSRQRPGGMLLFGYTFTERLWVSFGYDEAGFAKETVTSFWQHVIKAIDEFLLN